MNLDAKVDTEIFRKDHPIILASNRHLATIYGVRLAYDASGYKAGTVLGRNSVDGTYAAYSNSASSGLDTAASILFEDVPAELFPATTGTAVARGIMGGEVFKAKLTGLDASAITDLGARTIIGADGVEVLKF
jgi:hypothetical protein